MTSEEALAGLEQIIGEVACLPPGAEISLDQEFRDLDIDSLSMVEIAVAAQDAFGVEIPDDDLRDLGTVQDIVTYITDRA